jgi:hypothetical protein
MRGQRPTRPSEDICLHRGLDDKRWELMQDCWLQKPSERPSATTVVERLSDLIHANDNSSGVEDWDTSFVQEIRSQFEGRPFCFPTSLVEGQTTQRQIQDQGKNENSRRTHQPTLQLGDLDGDGRPSSATSAGLKFSQPSTITAQTSARASPSSTFPVRPSTFASDWAVSPKVLLVDDDRVIRMLSSRLLQVFGCVSDFAVDGQEAVNKMNLEKFDLVLMVSDFSAIFYLSDCCCGGLGYRHANAGRYDCDLAHPPVRQHDAYYCHDEPCQAG